MGIIEAFARDNPDLALIALVVILVVFILGLSIGERE